MEENTERNKFSRAKRLVGTTFILRGSKIQFTEQGEFRGDSE
jgi:hypothetical protein